MKLRSQFSRRSEKCINADTKEILNMPETASQEKRKEVNGRRLSRRILSLVARHISFGKFSRIR